MTLINDCKIIIIMLYDYIEKKYNYKITYIECIITYDIREFIKNIIQCLTLYFYRVFNKMKKKRLLSFTNMKLIN